MEIADIERIVAATECGKCWPQSAKLKFYQERVFLDVPQFWPVIVTNGGKAVAFRCKVSEEMIERFLGGKHQITEEVMK